MHCHGNGFRPSLSSKMKGAWDTHQNVTKHLRGICLTWVHFTENDIGRKVYMYALMFDVPLVKGLLKQGFQ